LIGPRLPQGTLVLLGGRRALLRDDGTLEAERAPAPEPLEDVLLVPTMSGDRLVGHGRSAIYAFADPLGPAVTLARSGDTGVHRIAAGPGWIAVWHADVTREPAALDAITGAERVLPGWPAARMQHLAFRDLREGVASFAGLGLAVSSDGGASFRALPTPGAGALEDLERRGRELRAGTGHDTAVVDVAAARLGPLTRDPPPTAPLLRWIAATGMDPLRAAIDAGVRGVAGDTAVVAAGQLLARVRLDTGAVVEIGALPSRLPGPPSRERCELARRADRGFVLCNGERPRSFPLGDDLARVRLTEVGPPGLFVAGHAIQRSPSGGIAFPGTCDSGSRDAVCVLGPDGQVEPVVSEALAYRNAGQLAALADGRLAWLGEPEDDPASPQRKRLHIELHELDGTMRSLPPFTLDVPAASVHLYGIEEAEGGALRALIGHGQGITSVRQPVDGGPAEIGATVLAGHAVLRDGRAMRSRVEPAGVDLSLDGGATWAVMPAPVGWTRPDEILAGENGIRFGEHLRLGWGGAPEPPPPAEAAGGAVIAWRRPERGAHRLVCKSAGDAGAAIDIRFEDDARARLEKASGPGPAAGKREVSVAMFRFNRIAVRLDAYAPEASADSPARWTLRWLDRADPAAEVHRAELAAPAGFGWGARIAGRMARGQRLVAAIQGDGGRAALIDVPSRGAPRVAFPVEARLVEHEDTSGALGASDGDPAVFLDGGALWIAPPGSAPRRLAEHAVTRREAGASAQLAAPGAGAVPVLLRGDGWAVWRALPLGGVPGAWFPLDGWQRVPASRVAVSALPACQGDGDGPVFRLAHHGTLSGEIDGHELGGGAIGGAVYDVRLAGASACLAGVTATLIPVPEPRHRDEAVHAIDVDVVRGTGRAIEAGPRARVRKLRCSLK
jgi:hypothetical protein